MRIVRIIIIIIAVVSIKTVYVYAEPLIGCTLIETNSGRTSALKEMFISSIGRFCETFRGGDLVNSNLLDDQIRRFGCTDERCLLSFMRDAKIDILISGSIQEKDNSIVFNIIARSYNNPFHGKPICTRTSVVQVSSKAAVRELGYIAQEEAALLLADVYSEYVKLLPVKKSDNGTSSVNEDISGNFDFYIVTAKGDDGELTQKSGSVKIEHGILNSAAKINETCYIGKTYKKESEEVKTYIYGRKKEIVTETKTLEHSLFAIPLVPFLSISSPITIPVGYYSNADYAGLSIAVINSAPWWYTSFNGLNRNFWNLRHARSELKKHDDGKYLFALYTLSFGSSGYVIDMMARESLSKARRYEERVPYICNDYTAVTLSIVAPGGGMFYRGNRLCGSIYYQMDNLLAYLTIKSFAEKKHRKSASYMTALVSVKIIEAIHAGLSGDPIMSGDIAGAADILPVVQCDADGSFRAGMTALVRW